MKNARFVAWVGFVVCAVSATARSQPLNDGDFNQGLAFWQVRGTADVLIDATDQPYVLLREPGTGAASQIWQSVTLPPSPNFLSFRYRFLGQASLSRPVLVAAASRRAHGAAGTFDVDVFAGETECRAAYGTVSLPTTSLHIVAAFDKSVALLNLSGGDVTTDHGVVSQVAVIYDTLEIDLDAVGHAAEVNLAFPGVVDDVFRRLDGGSEAKLCVVQVTGDFDNDGRLTDEDLATTASLFPSPTTVTAANFRADWNASATIDLADRTDVQNAGLVNDPGVVCPPPYPGATPTGSGSAPAIPPDSFSAFLIQQNSIARLGGMSLSEPDPAFTSAFYYEDAHGTRLYDSNVVTVHDEPDAAGMVTVTFDLSGFTLTETDARVVFALASAGNGVESGVRLDSVAAVCPPESSGWCCHPQTGVLTRIDDDRVCTEDVCDPTDGSVDHNETLCCGECDQVAADVVIMIDRTGSVTATMLAAEKEAAREILRRFNLASEQPRVAIGTFDVSTPNNARILTNGHLTDDYGVDSTGPDATRLFAAINSITTSTHTTDIEAAILAAMDELPLVEQPESYIIVISDGLPNRSSTVSSCPCNCPAAMNDADAAAAVAEQERGIDIIAVHFDATPPGCNGIGGPFMQNVLATEHGDDAYYFAGTGNLTCSFYQIASLVGCDDHNPCTTDECVLGICTHVHVPNCDPS